MVRELCSTLHQPLYRYYVPNPSYKGKRAAKKAAPPAAPKGQGDVEAPAGAAAAPKGIEFEPELELLKGITGYAQPTVLMALMGGSGAGGGVRLLVPPAQHQLLLCLQLPIWVMLRPVAEF
jgi:hypothetical protein